jgi:hypothetical protein
MKLKRRINGCFRTLSKERKVNADISALWFLLQSFLSLSLLLFGSHSQLRSNLNRLFRTPQFTA